MISWFEYLLHEGPDGIEAVRFTDPRGDALLSLADSSEHDGRVFFVAVFRDVTDGWFVPWWTSHPAVGVQMYPVREDHTEVTTGWLSFNYRVASPEQRDALMPFIAADHPRIAELLENESERRWLFGRNLVLGLIGNGLFFASLLVLLLVPATVRDTARALFLHDLTRCPRCKYPRAGLAGVVCPECGEELLEPPPESGEPQQR